MATTTVNKGDTLWVIAEKLLGDGSRWKELMVNGTPASEIDPTKLSIGATVSTAEPTDEDAQKEATEPEEDAETGDGDDGGVAPPLAGGQTIQVKADGQTRFYQIYEFPQGSGQFVSYQFNDKAQAEAALGEDFDRITRTKNWFDERVLAEGAFEEVAGQEGTWTGFTGELMLDAAKEAGIRDPSLAGRLASNPEMQQIMAQAIVGDWSDAQILAEQRRTDFWTEELYPGIDNFYGQTDKPEQAWQAYTRNVDGALDALGYERGPDGTHRAQIGEMLERGIDDQVFLAQAPTFQRAVQNVEFAGVLNQWAERDLGRNIEFNDWFDLMAGESAPELDEVAEKASIAFEAQNQGRDLSARQVEDLAARTELSPAEIQRTIAEFTQGLLALGAGGLERGQLSETDVLRGAAGIGSGDRSAAEIRLQMAKIAKENDLFDEEKINFFVGFSPEGTPERPGLQSLRPEGA